MRVWWDTFTNAPKRDADGYPNGKLCNFRDARVTLNGYLMRKVKYANDVDGTVTYLHYPDHDDLFKAEWATRSGDVKIEFAGENRGWKDPTTYLTGDTRLLGMY